MICPKCKSEYKKGITQCVDCGVDLVEKVDALEEKTEIIMMKPVKVYESDNEVEAEMLKEMLEKASIPCMLRGNGSGDYFRVYKGGARSFLGRNLYVDVQDVEKATEIISEITGKEMLSQEQGREKDTVTVSVDKMEEIERIKRMQKEEKRRRYFTTGLIAIIWLLFVFFTTFVCSLL